MPIVRTQPRRFGPARPRRRRRHRLEVSVAVPILGHCRILSRDGIRSPVDTSVCANGTTMAIGNYPPKTGVTWITVTLITAGETRP